MYQNYSVLMSVYYKENPSYLKSAIESMLNQTVPTNDFVLVCDGPLTKKLDSVINAFEIQHKELFHIVRLSENQGLGNALKTGILACKNSLVARMDSDDISLPERCELQLRQFQKNPELSLCSGYIAEFEKDIQHIKSIRQVPLSHNAILQFAKSRNPMNHMAVMYRKESVIDAGNYIEVNLAEDYYLWVRMLQKGCKAYNINQQLVYARVGNGMHIRRGGWSYTKNILNLQKKMLEIHFITHTEFVRNCVARIAGSLIPIKARKYLYEKLLRELP